MANDSTPTPNPDAPDQPTAPVRASGNRWEPQSPPGDGPDDTAQAGPAGVAPATRRERWRRGLAGKGLGVGAAVLALVVGLLGGFALGHATAGRGDDTSREWSQMDGHGIDGDRGPGGMPPDGAPGQGQPPGEMPGQAPGTDQQGQAPDFDGDGQPDDGTDDGADDSTDGGTADRSGAGDGSTSDSSSSLASPDTTAAGA